MGKLLISNLEREIKLSPKSELSLIQLKNAHYFCDKIRNLVEMSPNLEELWIHFNASLLNISVPIIQIEHPKLKWITLLAGEGNFSSISINCPELLLLKIREFSLKSPVHCSHGRISLEKVEIM